MPPKRKTKGRRPMNRQSLISQRSPITRSWQLSAMATPFQNLNARRDNKIYRIHQEVNYGNLSTSSAGGEVILTRAFLLSDLPQYLSLTSIFDQYCIEEIEMWIIPTTNTTGNAAGFDGYTISSVIDYDDDSTSAVTSASLQSYQNCVMSTRSEGVYRRWKPHIQSTLNNSSNAQVGALNIPATWIDAAQPTIKHYGMKLVQTATTTTSVVGLRARFHVAFRNVF
jgi:hypothetical protein